MRLIATVDNPSFLGEGTWMAHVMPHTLASIGAPAGSDGATSVLYLTGISAPEPDATAITFDPQAARVLNLGSSTRTLIVFDEDGPEPPDAHEVLKGHFGPRVQEDSEKLSAELKQLPEALARATRELIVSIAKLHPGYFQRTKAGRYVYRTKNFWTVKVQPRDQSVVITVFGRSPKLTAPHSIELLADQNSYSRFKLERADQFPDALEVLKRSAQLKGR